MSTDDPEKISVTVKTAAKITELSEDQIRRAIRSTGGAGELPPLPARRIGRNIRILREDLKAWVAGMPEA
ncbi:hypothetical protein CWT12_12435 [Actinomyces sp. 432]|uniref:helix-turn-helix domain-containing protein n=1 Tax=Actinomyces sp. 432 TaxID=2057798 RepID=UPI0013742DEF|nr:helix-turn-helix domain-containing protein [Actinomyces sp. 432]QHO91958.1 hypothetical protein CWT12_12435 [Actinomyces sp. 432]